MTVCAEGEKNSWQQEKNLLEREKYRKLSAQEKPSFEMQKTFPETSKILAEAATYPRSRKQHPELEKYQAEAEKNPRSEKGLETGKIHSPLGVVTSLVAEMSGRCLSF